MSVRSLLFLFCFFTLFFLLIIFGETTLGLLLFGGFSALFLLFRRNLDFTKIAQRPFLVFSAGGIVLVSILSLFSTVSIPMTMNKIMFFILGFECFLFFLTYDNWNELVENFEPGFVCCGVLLSIISIGLLFFPSISQSLPAQNLVAISFGHNHAASLFVAFLPFAWRFFELRKAKKWSLAPLLIILAGLLFSFSRLSILLGGFELVSLYFLSTNAQMKRVKKVVYLLLFLICILLSLFSGITFFSKNSSSHSCPIPQLEMQLCKPISSEKRSEYWQQAIESVKEKPLLGWGGGTFGIISLLHAKNEGAVVGFAHNQYLQLLAEYGITGSSTFFLFFFLVFIFMIIHQREIIDNKKLFYLLSFLSLSISACFDFDWSFISIWCFTTIIVSVLVRTEHVVKATRTVIIGRAVFILFALLLMSYSGLYLVNTWLWHHQKHQQATSLFPFVYWQAVAVMEDPSIHASYKTGLLGLYFYDPKTLSAYVSHVFDEKDREKQLLQLVSLDKYDFATHQKLLDFYISKNDPVEYLNEVKQIQSIFFVESHWSLSIDEQDNLTNTMIEFANQMYRTEQTDLAIQIYETALTIRPWQFSKLPVELFLHPKATDGDAMLALVTDADPKYFLKFESSIIEYWLKQIEQKIPAYKEDELVNELIQLIHLFPGSQSIYWKTASVSFDARLQSELQDGNINQAKRTIHAWNTLQEKMQKQNETASLDPMYIELLKNRCNQIYVTKDCSFQ